MFHTVFSNFEKCYNRYFTRKNFPKDIFNPKICYGYDWISNWTLCCTIQGVIIFIIISNRPCALCSSDFEITHMITPLIIKKQQFLHSDWLRACQLIPNQCKREKLSAKMWNWVQKSVIESKMVKLKWLTAPTLRADKQNGGQKLNEDWNSFFNNNY